MTDLKILNHDGTIYTVNRDNPLPVEAVAGAGAISESVELLGAVVGLSNKPTSTIVRPANATPYTAGDVLSDGVPSNLIFNNVARLNGGKGWLINAECICSANQATKPQIRLFLFTSAPAATADNSPWAITDAQTLSCIGYVDFLTFNQMNVTVGAGGSSKSIADPTPFQFSCAAGTAHLWGVPTVLNAYTPVSNESFKFSLDILQD